MKANATHTFPPFFYENGVNMFWWQNKVVAMFIEMSEASYQIVVTWNRETFFGIINEIFIDGF